MKSLTFEDLKALACGEPVWLIPQGPLPFQEKYYYKSDNEKIDEAHEVALYDEHDDDDVIISDADYGTKWIAYKNKEQAEAKGEIVEMPCKKGDTVYKVYGKCSGESCPMNGDYGQWRCHYKGEFMCKPFIDKKKFEYSMLDKIGKTIFTDKAQAKARLQELRGEK